MIRINKHRLIAWFESLVYDNRKRSGIYKGEYHWRLISRIQLGWVDDKFPMYGYTFHITVNGLAFNCSIVEQHRELDELVADCIKNQRFHVTYL
jgi:hypothetical protein